MYDEIVSSAAERVDDAVERVRYSPWNPWAQEKYHNMAPEGTYLTVEGFDFGQLHNWVDDEVSGTYFSVYQRALQKGMDKWDAEAGQPVGLDRQDYTDLLRTLTATERLLDAQTPTAQATIDGWRHQKNIEAGYRFVERAVDEENRINAAYEELMVDGMQQAGEDLDDLLETKAHAQFGPIT